jgi:polar amino acid transport system permease protein
VTTEVDTTSIVAPSVRRVRRPYKPPWTVVAPALVASIVVVVLVWIALVSFDGSLHLDNGALVIARIVEVAIAIAALAVPICAFLGLRALLEGRKLAAHDHITEARVKGEDAREWCWWVLGLGLATLIVSFLLAFLAGQDGKVRTVLFNWHYPLGHMDDLLRGFWLNVKLFMVTEAIVLVWALLVAVVRLIPGRAGAPVRFLAVVYTDVFRGIPALLVLFIVVFGFPLARLPVVDTLSRDSQLFWLSVFALTLTYGAYVTEVYRAGLESIHWSQTAASRSLGLSHVQSLRYVIIPQAVRRVIPPLLNDFIGLQKDTALVSTVGVLDIVNRSTILKGHYFNLSFLSGAALVFLIITIPLTRFTDYLIHKDQARMRAGGT